MLKSVDPIQESNGGPMTILAAQESPGFSNNESRGQNLFGTPQVDEHRHGVGVTSITGEGPRNPPTGVGEFHES